MADLTLGRRYIHSATDEPCTLRFIGPLSSAKGASDPVTWLGVEWDDPSRGKHSGTYQSVSYFNTRRANAGSFLRLPKDGSCPLRPGPTFWEAVNDRYLAPAEVQHEVTLGSSNGMIKVEVPNVERVAKRVKNVEEIREIGLERYWVSEVGKAPEAIKLEHLHTLDLSHNLLSSWSDLAGICDGLASLRRLIANFSRIAPLSPDEVATCTRAFADLEELHLASCDLSWQEATELSCIFPSVHTLSLASNPLDLADQATQTKPEAWQQLRYLDASRCSIDQWEDIIRCFGALKQLQTLNISSNTLTTIPKPWTCLSKDAQPFSSLRSIMLLRSRLASLLSLEYLNDLLGEQLKELRFSVIDGLQPDDSAEEVLQLTGGRESRSAVVAALQGLELLDGTEVTAKQRSDAERYFVSKMSQAGRKAEGSSLRFAQLCQAHQTPGNEDGAKQSAGTLRSRMMTLHIRPDAALASQPFNISVLPSVPMRVIRSKILRKIPLAGDSAVLSLSEGLPKRPIERNEDQTTVDQIGLGDGDVIYVKGIS